MYINGLVMYLFTVILLIDAGKIIISTIRFILNKMFLYYMNFITNKNEWNKLPLLLLWDLRTPEYYLLTREPPWASLEFPEDMGI